MKYLYTCFTYAYALPLALVAWVRGIVFRTADRERIGLALPTMPRGEHRLVWLVASSVGEVTIALKLAARIKSQSSVRVLLSVTTATGKKHAEQSPARPDYICYHPLDIQWIAQRYVRHFGPAAIVLIETELWPVLMTAAHEAAIPVVQVSGRISEKSLRRYFALRSIFAPLLQRCHGLWMQSPEDAERIRQIGAPPEIVGAIGSVKEDYVAPEPALLTEIDSHLAAWQGKRLWVCGSTRPGEEEILLQAFGKLRAKFANLRLVLVPRHLERVNEVVEIVARSEHRGQLWTSSALAPDDDVLIVDKIGVLNALYHRAEFAFVGGTLAEIGGHNLLEPALAARPVLYGPHFFQQQRSHELLQQFRMGYLVNDAAELATIAERILNDPQLRDEIAQRSRELRAGSSHVLDEYVARILAIAGVE